jgi:hypothetical protein
MDSSAVEEVQETKQKVVVTCCVLCKKDGIVRNRKKDYTHTIMLANCNS